MERETNTPVNQGLIGHLEVISQTLEKNPEWSRRGLLGALGITAVELTALVLKGRRGSKLEVTSTCPEGSDISCYLLEADIDNVPAATITTVPPETAPPVSETVPPETIPPPTEDTVPPEVVNEIEAPPRSMSYQEFADNAELFISNIPSLEALHAMFPTTPLYFYVAEQLAHIEMLNQTVQLTPEEYANFSFDMTYNGAFGGNRQEFAPHMLLWHWAVGHYDDPQQLADRMTDGESSVQLYVHLDNIAYQLVPLLNLITGHAQRVLNPIALGIEIYTGEDGSVRSPLFGYTTERVKSGLLTAVRALRSSGQPVNQATLLGHMTADLIFRNPYWDPYTGFFQELPGYKPISVRKSDPPQELMAVLVAKAMELDTALGPV